MTKKNQSKPAPAHQVKREFDAEKKNEISFFNKKSTEYIFFFLILIITAIVFSNAISHSFLNWDDNILVYDNKFVKAIARDGFDAIAASVRELSQNSPLTIISHAITCKIWGLSDPKPYHVINILLHIFNTAFVYLFIKLLTKQWKAAVVATVLFSVHPLRVESVAWIAERKDVLFAFFYLAGLICYMKYLLSGKRYWYLFVLLAFPLSVLSKFAGITFPFSLFLIDIYVRRKITWKSILEKSLFFIIMISAAVNEFSAPAAVESVEKFSAGYTFTDRFFFSGYSFLFYVIKFILPVNLSAMYPYPFKPDETLPTIYHAAPVIALSVLAIFIFAVYKFKNFRYELIFGFLFFLLNIFIVLHFVPFAGNVVMADRYTYLPHVGFCFIAGAWFGNRLSGETGMMKKAKPVLWGLLAVFVIFLIVQTWDRVGAFKNTLTLFTDATEKQPAPLTYYYRGIVNVGLKDYQAAIRDYDKALELNPKFFIALVERAKSKRSIRDYGGSVSDFDLAISIRPGDKTLYNDRGWVKSSSNDYSGALADFSKAIALQSDFFEAYMNRAFLKTKMKDFIGALDDYTAALKSSPSSVEVYNYRAETMVLMNNFGGAIIEYQKLIAVNPDNYQAYNSIGLIKSRNLRKVQEAVQDFTKAIQTNPGYKEAFLNRGIAHFELKDFKECISDVSRTLELEPKNALALLIRGHAKRNLGMPDACDDWKRSFSMGNQEAGVMLKQGCN